MEMGDWVAENRYPDLEYLRMAENTCGWLRILADGRKYLRMAENTCGWLRILADG